MAHSAQSPSAESFLPISSPPAHPPRLQVVLKKGLGQAGLQMTFERCASFHSGTHQLLHRISLKQTGMLVGKAESPAEGEGHVTNIRVRTLKAL